MQINFPGDLKFCGLDYKTKKVHKHRNILIYVTYFFGNNYNYNYGNNYRNSTNIITITSTITYLCLQGNPYNISKGKIYNISFSNI